MLKVFLTEVVATPTLILILILPGTFSNTEQVFIDDSNSSVVTNNTPEASEMQMYFTTSYDGVPILFEKLAPTTLAAFVGSLFVIALAAFCLRTVVFIRAYLIIEYWGKPMVCNLQ